MYNEYTLFSSFVNVITNLLIAGLSKIKRRNPLNGFPHFFTIWFQLNQTHIQSVLFETNNGGYRTEEIVGSQITYCLKSLCNFIHLSSFLFFFITILRLNGLTNKRHNSPFADASVLEHRVPFRLRQEQFPISFNSGFQPNQKTDKQGIYLD